eukprot:CAMPEP_0175070984 /NCGR_PEP_ID=MMETSP0052_2-20121109/18998_1 /TAXON_ID=51329 ORGANISM="Polytomella parva, Strain SAG 63-3" /NCGR_SAMPLE_ID=MMETSP0052_2 /ASSEMBLY_ACC=CAM_ASM_000194 /LENGTH=259 /DNA_ID=CAMNT_0016338119 /DNA_START=55 /DNA_END=832 /DNA_ORIENTATION=+
MPKRTTLTYTSDDAPLKQLGDGSYILTDENKIKLNTTDGGIKLIKRYDGRVESQHRYNVGKLPVAYCCNDDSSITYILDDAVSTYANQGRRPSSSSYPSASQSSLAAAVDLPPREFLPPCIREATDYTYGIRKPRHDHAVGGSGRDRRDGRNSHTSDRFGTELRLEIEDRAKEAFIRRITSDAVKIHCLKWLSLNGSNEEIYELMSKILDVRMTQMRIQKGSTQRIRFLLVDEMSPREVYDKIWIYMNRLKVEKEGAEE